MDISIIIVNFNTAKMTGECIESIYKHIHGIDFEIILVDNNSTDNSVAYLKKISRYGTHLIKRKHWVWQSK